MEDESRSHFENDSVSTIESVAHTGENNPMGDRRQYAPQYTPGLQNHQVPMNPFPRD